MGTEGNTTQSSIKGDFGVLEQYLGFQIGDPANINRGQFYNTTVNGQTAGDSDHQGGAFDKSRAVQLQLGGQPNQASAFVAQNENWGESNMADSSSRSDTSAEVDPDNRNHRFETGQSARVAVSDSSDKSKEKTSDQKTLRRLAQNREAARKSRLRKKAYVQQLENSRLKLTQMEQEVQGARKQGVFVSV